MFLSTSFLTVTDTVTSQLIDLSCWIILYIGPQVHDYWDRQNTNILYEVSKPGIRTQCLQKGLICGFTTHYIL
jgi:hypothetical protein